MISHILKTTAAALFIVATASAQNADMSANGSLKGAYFVREVMMTGTADGSVTAAGSAIGVATFDGNGNYAFTGQGTNLASGPISALSLTGTYSVAANGFFQMQSLVANATSSAFGADTEFGGVSALGPSAFVASTTEGDNVAMMVGIPIGSGVSNSSFRGNYTAGSIDFPSANITSVREATFNLTADGAGNLGNVATSGAGANLGGTILNQTNSGVTYSLSSSGNGTINFGAAANSQLVSGTKAFYISTDGNIILGGSPTGYDMLVGIRSLTSPASNATANQLYYMAGLEDAVDPTGQSTNAIDAFYGSENANGGGTSLFHNRINSLMYSAYDYTFNTAYTIASNGTIPIGSGAPYSYTFGVNGQAFIAIGDAVGSNFYSLDLGLGMPTYSGTGVYLSPNGIVNSASFAPITNPIAPNELITLFGTGLATAATGATSLPLPASLGGVQVMINGIAAPLDYVSPTEIIALVPSSISPDNNVAYATLQVISNNVKSNSVTVYTNDSAPGVFANPVAVGAAAAEHGANYSVISESNPAQINETIIVYLTSLGAVNPAVTPDGAPAPSNPLSVATDQNIFVDFSGVQAVYPVPFAGLTPTAAGLYQINVPIPTGTPSNVYVDVATTDGYTSQATLSVAGTGSAEAKAVDSSRQVQQRLSRRRTQKKKAGFRARISQ
jgi:uncharacterized protein (TIGR03437 family)